MTDTTTQAVTALLDGATQGRRVQFHPSYCPEAVGAPFSDWDTSHDMSVILTDGKRYKLATYRHAADAALSQAAPDLVRNLLAERDALAAQLAAARADALRDVNGYCTDCEQAMPIVHGRGACGHGRVVYLAAAIRALAKGSET